MLISNLSANYRALSAAIEQLSKLRIYDLRIVYSASGAWVSASARMTDGLFRYVGNTTASSIEETSEPGGRPKEETPTKSPQD